MLGHPQRILDLRTAAAAADAPADAAADGPVTDHATEDGAPAPGASAPVVRTGTGLGSTRTPGSRVTLYVHASLADLACLADPGMSGHSATLETTRSRSGYAIVERFGPAALDVVASWLGRCDRLVVRPVLHLTDPLDPLAPVDPATSTSIATSAATRPVDRHDPPEAMRELVILRDGACVFPGCGIAARRCDLDHIDPYRDPDQGGPPGQTSPANLAPLCRRHHRLKTFTAWHYQRLPDDTYRWTSPRGQTLTSTPLPPRAPQPAPV
jgi:hypothetical protein